MREQISMRHPQSWVNHMWSMFNLNLRILCKFHCETHLFNTKADLVGE